MSNSSRNLLEEDNKSKSDLESLCDYITAGIILPSKSKWYEHDKKSSKYFLNLDKCNKAKSHIHKLLTSVEEFYSSLYKQRSVKTEKNCLEYLHDINIPQQSQSESHVKASLQKESAGKH